MISKELMIPVIRDEYSQLMNRAEQLRHEPGRTAQYRVLCGLLECLDDWLDELDNIPAEGTVETRDLSKVEEKTPQSARLAAWILADADIDPDEFLKLLRGPRTE